MQRRADDARRGRCVGTTRRRREPPAVELRGITKRFPGVVANHDIFLTVRRGTIHAIVGENGAGKSTLMKILYGMQRPDEGEILVDGEPVTIHSPQQAIRAGIGMVHQHFMLADNFTVLENVVLGAEKLAGIGAAARDEDHRDLRRSTGSACDPDELMADLGVGDRQRVEILKVLYRGAQDRHPGRADRGAGAAGGRRALRQPPRADPRGAHRHLHLAQARRGAVGRRRDHGDPARHDRGHGGPGRASPRATWPR